jgi:hypothetical protein
MLIHRRKLLAGLIAAPLVVAADSLMPLRGAAVSLEGLVVYPFTLSWWERIADKSGAWRQNSRRFVASQVAPCIEVNPSTDTDFVSGVQVDSYGSWIGDRYFAPPPVSATWREGAKTLKGWRCGCEIELSKSEEMQLMLRSEGRGDRRPDFGLVAQ